MSFRSFSCSYKFRRSPHALTTPSVWGPVEIIPAAACSLGVTCYAFRGEIAVDDALPTRDRIIKGLIGVQRVSLTYELHETSRSIPLLPSGISHALLLLSYMVLACCVSSYRHRLRRREPYQGIVFLVWIAWASLVGFAAGCEVDTVLVAIAPWALTAGMLSSYLGHESARWLLLRHRTARTAFLP